MHNSTNSRSFVDGPENLMAISQVDRTGEQNTGSRAIKVGPDR